MGRWGDAAVRVPWGDKAMGRLSIGVLARVPRAGGVWAAVRCGRCNAGGAKRAVRCGRGEAGGAWWLTAAVWDPRAVGHAHRRWHRLLDRGGRGRLQLDGFKVELLRGQPSCRTLALGRRQRATACGTWAM